MSVTYIRTLIGDRKKAAVNEIVGEGDGVNKRFQFDMYPLASSPTNTVILFLTGVTAATNTYYLSGEVGTLTFKDANAPANGATILACYEYFALTSGEITQLESGYTAKPFLVAANCCLCIAADSARLFAYTMGDKSVDKRKVYNNLIDLAKTLENKHYTMSADNNYKATIMTFDDSGTRYEGYDTAVATLVTGTS